MMISLFQLNHSKPKSFNFPLQLNSLSSNPVLNENEERKIFEKLNVLKYLYN